MTTEDGYRLLGRAFYQEGESMTGFCFCTVILDGKRRCIPLLLNMLREDIRFWCRICAAAERAKGILSVWAGRNRKDNLLWLQTILKKDKNARIVIHGQSWEVPAPDDDRGGSA